MRVSKEKAEKARGLRLAGKTVAETARLAGLARNTVAKLEKGWVDSKGVLHGGWANELTIERLRDTAKRLRSAEAVLDRNECARIAAGLAQEYLGKILEFLPRFELKSGRDTKFLSSEFRELLKLVEFYRTSEAPPTDGPKQVVTLEDIKAHFERVRDITPSYIEPPEDSEALPGPDGTGDDGDGPDEDDDLADGEDDAA